MLTNAGPFNHKYEYYNGVFQGIAVLHNSLGSLRLSSSDWHSELEGLFHLSREGPLNPKQAVLYPLQIERDFVLADSLPVIRGWQSNSIVSASDAKFDMPMSSPVIAWEKTSEITLNSSIVIVALVAASIILFLILI